MKRVLSLAMLLAAAAAGLTATEPNADTRRWWSHVQALANDSMRGRDTGTPEHRRAQEYVVGHLERQGVRPAGEQGWFQPVPLVSYRLNPVRSVATIVRDGRTVTVPWLRQITIAPAVGLPAVTGPLVFAGSDNAATIDVRGAIVVRLNPVRLVAGPPQPPPPEGAAAVIGIDSIGGPEPARWPAQYAVTMTLADAPPPAAQGVPVYRFSPEFADVLFEGSGRSYREVMALASAGRPVPSFRLGATAMSLEPRIDTTRLSSDNVLGVLPGSDPALQREHVVLVAHVDGYGVGEPWGADAIYNGAFDNAAYVATLLDVAERLRETNTRLRRSLLFAVVTGEEKGLHGSRYFTQRPTIPREQLVAALNLDQLRPVFPLHTLTMHAIDESTLGDTARAVAGPMNIRLQADPEPLRNLLRRTDHWPFMQIGVPATSFIFGYQPGTTDEEAYRRWYADRYHTPLDDLDQPWVPEAAARFNQFFERLVVAVANADERPRWRPGSEFAASAR